MAHSLRLVGNAHPTDILSRLVEINLTMFSYINTPQTLTNDE